MLCKNFQILLFILINISLLGCKNDVLPKPKAYLSLNYPDPKYVSYNKACGFNFDYNMAGNVSENGNCNFKITYPNLKATVYLNYKPVNKNLDLLFRDAQKLTYEHVIKADGITEQPYANKERKAYGMFYEVAGNAASQSQFYLTDSTKHFLVGSVYFYAKPNFDSILPAAEYVKNDLRTLMESLKWK